MVMLVLRPKLFGLLFLGLMVIGSGIAAPEVRANGSFRCGSRLVRDGDTEDDVQQKCGEPDASRTWTEVQTEAYYAWGRKLERSVPVTYTEWKYDFGRHRLMLYITFVQGRSVHVKTGEYGHR